MDDLASGVLMLSGAGKGDREDLAVGALAQQVHAGVLHRQARAKVAVDPLDCRVLLRHRSLGDQVEDVGRPVLDCRVTDAGPGQSDQLYDRRVQRRGAVGGGGAALDVVHVGPGLGDDQRPLELAHVLGVDSEVGLERHLDVHPRGHVDERASRPHGRVQGGQLVVVRRYHGGEVLAHDVLVLAQSRVHVHEDHALLLEVLANLVVDDLGLVLGADAGQELPLRLGDPETVEGVLDILGHLVPRALGAFRRSHEIVDVVVVDLGQQRRTPGGLRARQEVIERLQAEVTHPLRLRLELRDLLDELPRQPFGRLVQIILRVVKAVALRVVGVDLRELFILRRDGRLWGNGFGSSHYSTSSLMVLSSMITGKVSTGT